MYRRSPISRIGQALAGWRQPAWPMLPLAQLRSGYRWLIVMTMAVEIVGIAAAIGLNTVSLEPQSFAIMACAIVAGLVLGSGFLEANSAQSEDPFILPAFALALSGAITAGLCCAVIGATVKVARKPLVPHLVLANLVHMTTMVIGVGALAPIVGGHDITTARWMVGALLVMAFVDGGISLAVGWTARVAGYLTTRDMVRELARAQGLNLASNLPQALMVAMLLTLVGPPALPLLFAPGIVGFVVLRRQHQLVAARRAAQYDSLTGLLNRTAFEALLSRIIAEGTPSTWLLLCDLDGFQTLLSTQGRAAGDRALQEAATYFDHAAASNSGHAGRIESDGFAMIVTAESETDIRSLTKHLCHRIESRLQFLSLTCSIGAHQLSASDTAQSALDRADIALSLSKHGGGNDAVLAHEPTLTTHQLPEDAELLADDEEASRRIAALEYWSRVAEECAARGDRWQCAHARYQQYWASTDDSEALAYLQAAQDAGTEDVGWASRAAAAAAARSDNLDAARHHDAHALELAREMGDSSLEVVALLGLARTRWLQQDVDEALALQRQAARVALTRGSFAWYAQALNQLVGWLEQSLQFEEARETALQLEQTAVRRGLSSWVERSRLQADRLRRLTSPTPEGDVPDFDMSSTGQQRTPLVELIERERQVLDGESSPDAARALIAVAHRWRTAGVPRHAAQSELRSATMWFELGELSATAERCERLMSLDALGATDVETVTSLLERSLNGLMDAKSAQVAAALSVAFPSMGKRSVLELARHASITEAEREQTIFHAGSALTAVHLVMDGSVRLTRRTSSGKTLTLAMLDHGDVFGESLLFGYHEADTHAEARETSTVASWNAALMSSVLDSEPGARSELATRLAQRMRTSSELAERVAYWTVRRRFAQLLLELASKYGTPTLAGDTLINKRITGDEFAELLGSTRQAYVTELGLLRKAGVVSVQRRRVVVHDLRALEAISFESPEDEPQRISA